MEANIAEVSTQLGAIAAALPDAVRAAVREEHQPVTTSLERTISLCEQRLQASGTRITELETEGLVVKKQLQDAFASNAELKTQVRGLEQRLQGIASLNEKLHGATALNTRLKDDFARSSAQFETRLAALESKGVGPKHAEAIVRDEKDDMEIDGSVADLPTVKITDADLEMEPLPTRSEDAEGQQVIVGLPTISEEEPNEQNEALMTRGTPARVKVQPYGRHTPSSTSTLRYSTPGRIGWPPATSDPVVHPSSIKPGPPAEDKTTSKLATEQSVSAKPTPPAFRPKLVPYDGSSDFGDDTFVLSPKNQATNFVDLGKIVTQVSTTNELDELVIDNLSPRSSMLAKFKAQKVNKRATPDEDEAGAEAQQSQHANTQESGKNQRKKSKRVSYASTPATLKRGRSTGAAIPDNLDAAAAAGDAIEVRRGRRSGREPKKSKKVKEMEEGSAGD